jgi:hypothetical protein
LRPAILEVRLLQYLLQRLPDLVLGIAFGAEDDLAVRAHDVVGWICPDLIEAVNLPWICPDLIEAVNLPLLLQEGGEGILFLVEVLFDRFRVVVFVDRQDDKALGLVCIVKFL